MEGLSRYQIRSQIGQGGMGVVYLAHDLQLERDVALKFSGEKQDPAARKNLVREARAASRLSHPNIAQIYDYGETPEGRPFIVMELVNGESLTERLAHGGGRPMETAEVLRIGRAIAEALAEAHEAGLLHRDIKPGNVMITVRGEIKVLDFGLARPANLLATTAAAASSGEGGPEPKPQLESRPGWDSMATSSATQSVAGEIKGTPGYMAPEQARGLDLDGRCDLFSLGCVLYECLTGRRPFDGETLLDTLTQVLTFDPPAPAELVPAIPPNMNDLVMRLLAKRPEDRPESAREVANQLSNQVFASTLVVPAHLASEAAAAAAAAAAATTTAAAPTGKGWSRKAALAFGLALVVVVGGLALAVWFRPGMQMAAPARRWYAEGLIARQDGAWQKAGALLQKAVSLDPGFGPAHARLAQAWLELDCPACAKDEILRASQSRGWWSRWTAPDTALIEAVQLAVLGENEKCVAVLAEREQAAPAEDKALAAFDHGWGLERGERWKEALDTYRRALAADSQMAGARVRLARVLAERLKKYPEAKTELDGAAEVYRAAGNREGLAEVEYSRALIEIAQNQPAQAEARLRQLIESAGGTENQQLRVKSSLLLVSVLLNRGDLKQAERLAAEAVEIARATGLESLTTRSLIDAGRVMLIKGELEGAERHLRQAMETAKRTGDRRSEARAGSNFGSLLYTEGRFAEALTPLQAARQFYQQGSYPRQLLPTLVLLGRVQLELSQYRESGAAFQQALEMGKSSADPMERGQAEEGLGSVARRRERYREADAHYERAGQAYEQAQNRTLAAYVQIARASLLSGLGNFAAANALFGQADATARQHSDKVLQMAVAAFQAESFARQERWVEALAAARRGQALADRGDRGSQVRLASLAALAQAGLGQAEQAAQGCSAAVVPDSPTNYEMAQAGLRCARVLLAARQPERAAERARRCAAYFAEHDHPESEWMAWAVAARANPPDPSLGVRAREQLRRLGSLWPAGDYEQYLRRPDVIRMQPAS